MPDRGPVQFQFSEKVVLTGYAGQYPDADNQNLSVDPGEIVHATVREDMLNCIVFTGRNGTIFVPMSDSLIDAFNTSTLSPLKAEELAGRMLSHQLSYETIDCICQMLNKRSE